MLAQVTHKVRRRFFPAMSIRPAPSPKTEANAAKRATWLLAAFCVFAFPPACRAAEGETSAATAIPGAQENCANVAASAEAVRIERRRQQLASLEKEIATRLAALDEKREELRKLLERLDAFERKTSDSLVGLYARMKPEAAAAQLAQLDDDIAAALMLQLKSKISSSILAEMEASRGAALAKRIAELHNRKDGKRP